MNFNLCPKCRRYADLDRHRCEIYEIEVPDLSISFADGCISGGADPEIAVQNWAEEFDSGGDYSIVSSGGVDGVVRTRDSSGNVVELELEARMVAEYTAKVKE